MENIKSFEEFINESYYRTSDHVNPMNFTNVYQSFNIPSFTVKLLGMATAKDETEQRGDGGLGAKRPIMKGSMVEVYDNKKKKIVKGSFLTGKKDKDGEYYEVTIIDEDEKVKVIKTDGVRK